MIMVMMMMMMMMMMMTIYGDAHFVSVQMNKLFHRIPLPDSERISCGFKNIRICVSQITYHQIYKTSFNAPKNFFVSFLFSIGHIAFCMVLQFTGKLQFACEYAHASRYFNNITGWVMKPK